MYAQPTHNNPPGYGAAQSPIASIVQDTVMRLKDLDVRLEVVNQELAQLCDAVGASQVAQLARTPVQAFLPGLAGSHPSNVPQVGAAINPSIGAPSNQTPGAGFNPNFSAPANQIPGAGFNPHFGAPVNQTLGAGFNPNFGAQNIGAAINPWAANLSPFAASPYGGANAFAASPYVGATIDPTSRWAAPAINAFSPVSATVDPYAAWNAAQNASTLASPYATATPTSASVQTPFTTGFIR